jgi:hypothetical protein
MKKVRLNRRQRFLNIAAVAIAIMIITSSAAFIKVIVSTSSVIEAEAGSDFQSFLDGVCEIKSIQAQSSTWIAFDTAPPGSPAEVHMTVSDTTGITIVADFHGFWRENYTINGTEYDDLEMPGAYSMNDPGNPKLPSLFKYVEIPHDIGISTEVVTSSNASAGNYSIRPAPPLIFPAAEGKDSVFNTSLVNYGIADFFSSVYSSNSFFPGFRTSVLGKTSQTSIVVRGHRLVGLSIYPVQFNPVLNRILVFSQLVIRVKYSRPAQIEPIPRSLQSEVFEQILEDAVLNYDSAHRLPVQPGVATSYTRTPPPSPSLPNATVPMFQYSSASTGNAVGAEYLIITSEPLGAQAQRLAEWKERKGVPSAVVFVPEHATTEDVRGIIEWAYNDWYLAPTYVLLFGDVEVIPANYDMIYQGNLAIGIPIFKDGHIASDLGYFNIQGNSYFPDMIYSRISVDTEDQARVIVDKILNYEQAPPEEDSFYDNILSAGTFEDWRPNNGVEDAGYGFLSHLENIRSYLAGQPGYYVHYNYSCAASSRDQHPEYFITSLDYGRGTSSVSDYIPSDYNWLWDYDNKQQYRDEGRSNITANFNEGRFFVYYYSHGGSRNMIWPVDWEFPRDGQHDDDDRDLVEGWHSPCFDTSCFSGLANGNELPLVLSIACDTGWFDGETDQEHIGFADTTHFDHNPFADCENECFAENLTRLLGGGAIAVIAPSRPSLARIGGDLLDGIIQAFWPGYLESGSYPVYEMGAALFSGKLYAAGKWLNTITPTDVVRTTYEIYHLFGDPETQLWTEAPSTFNVTHPESIGTSNPQKFVVTVKDNRTGNPISYAKVCIQQNPYVYQVGYTDSRGQIIFDVDPPDSPSFLNVTVTKHNYIPYLGGISVVRCFDAKVTVNPDTGLGSDIVRIDVIGFDNAPATLYFGSETVSFDAGNAATLVPVPKGNSGYVNVIVVQEDIVAVTRFFRLLTDQNPDPYVYSYADPTTWYLADNELVWDNPCIVIYQGRTPVARVTQRTEYRVNVTVYNRGDGDAINTDVTLWYAPFGGGVSWTNITTKTATIPLFGFSEVSFNWIPQFPNTACLKVTVSQENETPEDQINNVGLECWNVIPVCSPGQSNFAVGNPSDNEDYVFIDVRQEGSYDDVWYASIQNYASQPLNRDKTDTATLLIDPGVNLAPNSGRLFSAKIYMNGELLGGMAFYAYCERRLICFIILIILAVVIIGVIVWYIRRRT